MSVKNTCAIIVILLFIAGVMVVVDRSTATTPSPTIATTTSTAPDNVMPEAVDNVAATAPQVVAEIELDDQAAAAFAELGPRDSGITRLPLRPTAADEPASTEVDSLVGTNSDSPAEAAETAEEDLPAAEGSGAHPTQPIPEPAPVGHVAHGPEALPVNANEDGVVIATIDPDRLLEVTPTRGQTRHKGAMLHSPKRRSVCVLIVVKIGCRSVIVSPSRMMAM